MSHRGDEHAILAALVAGGLPKDAAVQKLPLFSKCIDALGDRREHGKIHLLFVPGRIEVLGKHTDYAGGDSLLCAVSHGFCFAVRSKLSSAGESPVLSVINAESGAEVKLRVGEPKDAHRGQWSTYPNTVWQRLQANLSNTLSGGAVAFASDLPSSAGISSSSAIVVGTFLALDAINDIRNRTEFVDHVSTIESLGDYLGCVENGRDYPGMPGTIGVGTTGGSQDQTAILCARQHELQHFSFSPTTFRQSVAMPEGMVFVVASSGVEASKAGNALEQYNRAGSRATEVVRIWNLRAGENHATLGDIVRGDSFDAQSLRRSLLETESEYSVKSLTGRFDQFYAESFEIIPSAVTALQKGAVKDFAELVQRSQDLAEKNLENQVPETIALVQLAKEEGAVAASAFGAGFGGSVWAMVAEADAQVFTSRLASRYRQLFPVPARRSRFFVERPGPGAFMLADLR